MYGGLFWLCVLFVLLLFAFVYKNTHLNHVKDLKTYEQTIQYGYNAQYNAMQYNTMQYKTQ